VRLERDQVVTFFLTSDDGSRLFIDNQLLVENGGVHPALEKSDSISLGAGEHVLRVEFFQGGGGLACRLFWSGEELPGIENSPGPPVVHTAYTDNKGQYRFGALPPGKYQVRVHTPGKQVYAGLDGATTSAKFTALRNPAPDDAPNVG